MRSPPSPQLWDEVAEGEVAEEREKEREWVGDKSTRMRALRDADLRC